MRLDKWQMKEYQRKASDIRSRAEVENRAMTHQEQAQVVAFERAAFGCLADSAARDMLRKLRAQARRGGLSRIHLRIAKLLARNGYRDEIQRILDASAGVPVRKLGNAGTQRVRITGDFK
jgi:hypothetical protein